MPKRAELDPNKEEMRRIGYSLIDKIVEHSNTLSDQPVARRGTSDQYAGLIHEKLSEDGSSIEDCVEFYFQQVVPLMTRVNHPRFHGFIPCPSSFAGVAGMTLAAGTNPFVGSWLGGATVAYLELLTLDWIKDLLQLEQNCQGIFTSGGSIANLIGLASARAKYGRDVLNQGTIYLSEEGHASVEKAALVLGFDADNIRIVKTDSNFRMDLARLRSLLQSDRSNGLVPFLVSANAGTTNTGSIDPLLEIAKICKEENLWFHVDAAYGGFAAALPEIRELMNGIELADSLTLDPHKWLYCPMGVGCALVRDPKYLEEAFSTHGSYLKDLNNDEVNFLDRGPELSRPARVLPVWMVLRSFGRKKLVDQIRTDIEMANYAADFLKRDDRFEVDPVRLSVVTFRHVIADSQSEDQRRKLDESLMETTLAEGEIMLSSTTLHGKSTLRLVVMNHRTTKRDIERSVNCVLAACQSQNP